MRVCIIVPTTDGPAPILRLTRLSQAPRSVMRTQDDYRPLPPSARYHAFVQAGGALANLTGYGAEQFELRLGGTVETGRSWELPVAIAHWLHEQGHELATDAPDLLVWATGALDNDLCLLSQDYHLARKLDASAACLQEALSHGARVLLVLPEAIALPPELNCQRVDLHLVADFCAAVQLLEDDLHAPGLVAASNVVYSDKNYARGRAGKFGVAVASLLVGVITLGTVVFGDWDIDLREATTLRSAEPSPSEINLQDEPFASGTPIPPVPAAQDDTAGQAVAVSPERLPREIQDLPHLVLEYAPEGSNCPAVLFGSLAPDQRDLVPVAGAYPDIRLTGLCGIGFSLSNAASNVIEVALPQDMLEFVLPSDHLPILRLRPGETRVLRLRATLPEALITEIGFSSDDWEVVTLSLSMVR